MRKINYKLSTLVIWTVVLGIISIGSIVLATIGILIKTGTWKVNVPADALLITGFVLIPWVLPLFILLIISAVKKHKQILHPELIEKIEKKKTEEVKNHAIHKMREDHIIHTKKIKSNN